MRIFLVSNMYPSDKDHLFGVFVKNFKNELEKQGVQFSRTALIYGKSYSKTKKIFRYLKHFAQIWRNFFFKDYDLFYVHYLTHHIPILLLLMPFKKKPWVVNVHGSDINSLIHHKHLRFWGQLILKRIDLLVVPTPDFVELVRRFFPSMDSYKITVSPSGGVDKSMFYPVAQKKDDKLVLGFISRLTEEKGWKVFLDAMLLLKKEGVSFKAIIGGKGPDEQLIKSEINRLGLKDLIDFRGFIYQQELYKVYNELSIYIFPTFRDSLGLTGLEAMSCGIPVITSKIEGGPTTYVEHGVNGFLFDTGNSRQLAKIIIDYMTLNDTQKRKFKEAAILKAGVYEKTRVAHLLKEKLNVLLHGKLL